MNYLQSEIEKPVKTEYFFFSTLNQSELTSELCVPGLCQGLLATRRHVKSREDPENEVDNLLLFCAHMAVSSRD